mgnify:CR=1 FL=1
MTGSAFNVPKNYIHFIPVKLLFRIESRWLLRQVDEDILHL